jgi:hypothetical protein
MNRKIIPIIIAILLMSVLSMQAGIRIGVKGGANLANVVFNTDAFQTENFTGFQVGPIIEIGILPALSVDAAVLYSQQGFILKNTDLEQKSSTIDIPANLKFHLSFVDQLGIYLSAGPYISFKVDDQTTWSQAQTAWRNKKFGAGLNFGAGFELFKHLQIGANYQICLSNDYSRDLSQDDAWADILQDGHLKGETRIWSITATYFF